MPSSTLSGTCSSYSGPFAWSPLASHQAIDQQPSPTLPGMSTQSCRVAESTCSRDGTVMNGIPNPTSRCYAVISSEATPLIDMSVGLAFFSLLEYEPLGGFIIPHRDPQTPQQPRRCKEAF